MQNSSFLVRLSNEFQKLPNNIHAGKNGWKICTSKRQIKNQLDLKRNRGTIRRDVTSPGVSHTFWLASFRRQLAGAHSSIWGCLAFNRSSKSLLIRDSWNECLSFQWLITDGPREAEFINYGREKMSPAKYHFWLMTLRNSSQADSRSADYKLLWPLWKVCTNLGLICVIQVWICIRKRKSCYAKCLSVNMRNGSC